MCLSLFDCQIRAVQNPWNHDALVLIECIIHDLCHYEVPILDLVLGVFPGALSMCSMNGSELTLSFVE